MRWLRVIVLSLLGGALASCDSGGGHLVDCRQEGGFAMVTWRLNSGGKYVASAVIVCEEAPPNKYHAGEGTDAEGQFISMSSGGTDWVKVRMNQKVLWRWGDKAPVRAEPLRAADIRLMDSEQWHKSNLANLAGALFPKAASISAE